MNRLNRLRRLRLSTWAALVTLPSPLLVVTTLLHGMGRGELGAMVGVAIATVALPWAAVVLSTTLCTLVARRRGLPSLVLGILGTLAVFLAGTVDAPVWPALLLYLPAAALVLEGRSSNDRSRSGDA